MGQSFLNFFPLQHETDYTHSSKRDIIERSSDYIISPKAIPHAKKPARLRNGHQTKMGSHMIPINTEELEALLRESEQIASNWAAFLHFRQNREMFLQEFLTADGLN
jgi:hypothetical protein